MSATFNSLGVGGFTTTEEQVLNPSEYNPYSPVEYDDDTEKLIINEIYPQSEQSGKNGVPFHFILPADPTRYTNMRNIRFSGELRVWNSTKNAEPKADEDWSVINNYQQSLISHVNCKINDQEINDPGSKTYAYRSFIETLLNYTKEYKETILRTSGWVEDEARKGKDKFSSKTGDANYNKACKERRVGIATGGWKEFDILLHHDVITSIRNLPPGYRMEFTITRTSDAFLFVQPEANKDIYKIELRRVHLRMERREVADRVLQNYLSQVGSKIARLPLTRNYVRAYPVQKGQTDLSCYNIINTDVFPKKLTASFVYQKNYDGTVYTNPFYFEYIPLRQASLIINSVHEPQTPLDTTTTGNKKLSVFHYFCENTGGSQRDSLCGTVDYDKYYGGYHLIPFDLTPNKDNGAKRQRMSGGTISVNMRTETALTDNIVVILYASYDSTIEAKGSEVFTRTF